MVKGTGKPERQKARAGARVTREVRMEIQQRLRSLMHDLEWNQSDLADAAGVANGTVTGWFNERVPKVAPLRRLAIRSGRSVDWLLCISAGGDGEDSDGDKMGKGTYRTLWRTVFDDIMPAIERKMGNLVAPMMGGAPRLRRRAVAERVALDRVRQLLSPKGLRPLAWAEFRRAFQETLQSQEHEDLLLIERVQAKEKLKQG